MTALGWLMGKKLKWLMSIGQPKEAMSTDNLCHSEIVMLRDRKADDTVGHNIQVHRWCWNRRMVRIRLNWAVAVVVVSENVNEDRSHLVDSIQCRICSIDHRSMD